MPKNKQFILLLLCILLLYSCKPTDVKTHSPTLPFKVITTQHLFTVATPDFRNIWVGGYKSTIMHSSDGGTTWKTQRSNVSSDICSIGFVDSNTGWAVGKEGTILSTKDGGETWSMQKSPTNNHLFSVYFFDKNNGWAAGSFASVVHTIDGGATWVDQHQEVRKPLDAQLKKEKTVLVLKPQDPTFNAIHAVDPDHVWIVGEYGTILYSSNGGDSWQMQECRDIYPVVSEKEWISPVPSLYSVYFTNENNGWAVGMDGIVLRTMNGGKNWEKLSSPLAEGKPTLYRVKAIGNKAWAVGQYGEYMFSFDGGDNWQRGTGCLLTRCWLRDMDFADENFGIAAGESGTIVCTRDGGKNWTMLSGMPLRPADF